MSEESPKKGNSGQETKGPKTPDEQLDEFMSEYTSVSAAQKEQMAHKKELLKEAKLDLSGMSVDEIVQVDPKDIELCKLLAEESGNISTLKMALNALRNLRLLVRPGAEIAAYKALSEAHIRLEEINDTNVKPILLFLAEYLRGNEDIEAKVITQFVGQYNFDDKASPEELWEYQKKVFVDEDSSRKFNTIFNGVHYYLKNVPRDEKYHNAAIENFSLIQFAKDPAFTLMFAVVDFIPKQQLRTDPELPIIIARNLYAKDITASKKSVENEIEALNKLRSEYKDVLFLGPGQGVTIISNNESFFRREGEKGTLSNFMVQFTLHDGESAAGLESFDRFGTQGLIDAIKKTGATVNEIEPKQSVTIENGKIKKISDEEVQKDIESKKKEAISQIVNAPPGHFFIFDGHGGIKAFWLSHGTVGNEQVLAEKEHMLIDSETFSSALTQRYAKYKDDPEKLKLLRNDKFLFSACFSKNLQQNIDIALGNVPYRPIIIAVSEFGQIGYRDSSDESETKSVALDTAFCLGKDGPIYIGDVLKQQASAHVNISILVPAQNKEKTIMLQIVATEQKESKESKTA